jgi:hypothetical protein
MTITIHHHLFDDDDDDDDDDDGDDDDGDTDDDQDLMNHECNPSTMVIVNQSDMPASIDFVQAVAVKNCKQTYDHDSNQNDHRNRSIIQNLYKLSYAYGWCP